MPSFIMNYLFAPAEVITAILNEEDHVDFNNVVPQPENIERGGCQITGHDPDVICWYTWNIRNWGTKWNALDTAPLDNGVLFETASEVPWPVYRSLSQKFPQHSLRLLFAHENLGSYCGDVSFKDGKEAESHMFLNYSPEAKDFAARLWYGKTYAEIEKEYDNV